MKKILLVLLPVKRLYKYLQKKSNVIIVLFLSYKKYIQVTLFDLINYFLWFCLVIFNFGIYA